MKKHMVMYFVALLMCARLLYGADVDDTTNELTKTQLRFMLNDYAIYLPIQYGCICFRIGHHVFRTQRSKNQTKNNEQIQILLSQLNQPNWSAVTAHEIILAMETLDDYGNNFKDGALRILKTCINSEKSKNYQLPTEQQNNLAMPLEKFTEEIIKNPDYYLFDNEPHSDDDKECKICLHNISKKINLPCGHLAPCDSCINDLKASRGRSKNCHICRASVNNRREYQDWYNCLVCEQKKIAIMFFSECGHLMKCDGSHEEEHCPFCKRQHEKPVRVYLNN